MTAINIGDIAKAYSNARLPSSGIIIEATREELQGIAGNILYRDVMVIDAACANAAACAKNARDAEYLSEKFYAQISRCGEICDRLKAEKASRKYSRDEVYAIIDELLDGIKPEKEEQEESNGNA